MTPYLRFGDPKRPLADRGPDAANGSRIRWITVSLALGIFFLSRPTFPQELISDQVAVTVIRKEVIALTLGEGQHRIDLSAGEEVLAISSRGLNAVVQTSVRLLGFSGKAKRWAERRLHIYEKVTEVYITTRLILVRTDRRLYGFEGVSGRWSMVEIAPREEQLEILRGEHVVVVVTEQRALAFSAFSGGFFQQDLPPEESVVDTVVNDNIVILTTPVRKLVFRAGLRLWSELR